MRIRFGVGLPGPFWLTSGRSRGRGGLAFGLVLVGLLAIAWPWFAVGVAAFVGLVAVCVAHDRRHGIPVGRRR